MKHLRNYKNVITFVLSLRQRDLMHDDDELKARVDNLIEQLNYYLRNYNRLIGIGYRKSVLDGEIRFLVKEIKQLSKRV